MIDWTSNMKAIYLQQQCFGHASTCTFVNVIHIHCEPGLAIYTATNEALPSISHLSQGVAVREIPMGLAPHLGLHWSPFVSLSTRGSVADRHARIGWSLGRFDIRVHSWRSDRYHVNV